MLDEIAREHDVSFIVYDGNVKGPAEACRDKVYEARHDLLDASRTPLVLVPGQHDWADCGLAQAGGYDPVERLDFMRQLFFGDSNSLGTVSLSVTRESEVARFRPFRENVRWQTQGVAFIGMNAPSPNNHYLTAGGRNGEYRRPRRSPTRSGSSMRRNRRGVRSSARSSSSCKAIRISRATSDATVSRGCVSLAAASRTTALSNSSAASSRWPNCFAVL